MKPLALVLVSSVLLISNCFAVSGGKGTGLNISVSKVNSALEQKDNITLKLNDKEWICQPQSNTKNK